MRKNLLPPLLAVLGGAVGFGLRKWQLATGFEPDTGLAIPHAPAAVALAVWSVLVAAALLALVWNQREALPWQRAFGRARGNTVYLTAAVLSGFLLLLSAGAEMFNYSASYQAVLSGETPLTRAAAAALPPLRILCGVGGLPCVLLWAGDLYRGGEKGKESLPLLELCLLFCLWLISAYQLRAADPVTQDYVYEVLAIVLSLLGLYYIAGYSFQTGKPRRTLMACLLGTYLSLVTLADAHALSDLLRCGFAVLFLTAHAALILHPGEAPEEEGKEEAEDHA